MTPLGAVAHRDGPQAAGAAEDVHHLDVVVTHTDMAQPLAAAIADGSRVDVRAHPTLDDVPDAVAAETDVLVGFHFPPASLTRMGRLRWLHLTGSGVDHLPATGLRPDVLVTTSARVPVDAVAEYAVAGLLHLAKDLGDERGRRHRPWFTGRATMLAGSTVAVVGAGRIGRAVIDRLAPWGVNVVAVTRPGSPAGDVPGAARTVPSDRFAAEAPAWDHVVLCLPAGSSTDGLVGAAEIAALPPRATIVNVGRAACLDSGALFDALAAGRLRGAFLDVHDEEPLGPDHPAWDVPNLTISPHCAFAFPGEVAATAAAFLANLDDLRRGRPLRDAVPWPA